MDADKPDFPELQVDRIIHITFGVMVAAATLRSMAIPLRDAKIAMRVGAFMLEELWRKNPKDDAALEQMGKEFAPEVLAMIKAEIAAEQP